MRRACPLLLLVRRFAFSSFSVTGSSASSSSTIANGGGNGAEPLRITPSAVEQLRRVSKGGECLRVCVDSGGCSGFEYKLSLDSTVNADDEVIRKEDVCVVVDKLSLEYIRGSKLDFTQDLMRSAFRITDNPAASQGCSCGASFTPKSMI